MSIDDPLYLKLFFTILGELQVKFNKIKKIISFLD